MRTVGSQSGSKVTHVGSATETMSVRSEFIFRPVPCKRMKRNVWRPIRSRAGLSSSGSRESVAYCDRDGICSYYINKTLCSLVNCWFFQVRNIQYNDFRNSLKVVRPSLSPHSLKFFEEWNSLYGSSAWEWSYRTEKMENVDWYSKISSLSYLLPLTKEFWLSSRERKAKKTNLKRCLSWSFMLNALEFNCIFSFLRLPRGERITGPS